MLPAAAGQASAPGVVRQAEGWRLHLSPKSSTGYLGVVRQVSGRYEARRLSQGTHQHLGLFDTAVEAAIAYAKHVAT